MIDKTNRFYSIYLWKASEDGSFFLGGALFPRSSPVEFGIDRDWDGEAYGPYYVYMEWLGENYKLWKLKIPTFLAKRLP